MIGMDLPLSHSAMYECLLALAPHRFHFRLKYFALLFEKRYFIISLFRVENCSSPPNECAKRHRFRQRSFYRNERYVEVANESIFHKTFETKRIHTKLIANK